MNQDEDGPVEVAWPRPYVAVVALNRPDRLNALTLEAVDEVAARLAEVGAHDACRVVVLTGRGRGFCAGLDLADGGDDAGGDQDDGASADRQDAAARLASQERFVAMVRAVRGLRQPVVAAVNGAAAGAGLGLALAADTRIAAESARFHVASVKLGLSAGECGISYHLPRQLGAARAAEIMLTGRPFDAAEADRIGLVTRVVADDDLLDAALELADAIATNSPFAVWMSKQLLWANLDAGFDTALELENRTQILATLTDDAREAMAAFAQKRTPSFRPQ